MVKMVRSLKPAARFAKANPVIQRRQQQNAGRDGNQHPIELHADGRLRGSRLPQHGLNKRAHHWPIGRRPATVGSPADHFGQTPGPAPFSAAVSGQDTHAIMAAAGIHPDD